MSSASDTRKSLKFRRRGRHAAPSPAAKIAGQATMAAPAVAIAGGVIIGGGTASAATATASAAPVAHSVAHHAVTRHSAAHHAAAQHATLDAATTATRTYEIQSGDTLAGLAQQFYGDVNDWHWLYDDNTSTISDPNLIYPGQVIDVPSSAPADTGSASADTSTASTDTSSASADTSTAASTSAASTVTNTAASYSGALSGTLSCSGLEQLWEDAGGSPAQAFTAAEIAMAESGGNQYAVSPTDDYGYWQINAVHGAEATFDPIGNAEAAVSISDDGADWTPWTTYTTGAYEGRC